jgi:hypothetical protein
MNISLPGCRNYLFTWQNENKDYIIRESESSQSKFEFEKPRLVLGSDEPRLLVGVTN